MGWPARVNGLLVALFSSAAGNRGALRQLPKAVSAAGNIRESKQIPKAVEYNQKITALWMTSASVDLHKRDALVEWLSKRELSHVNLITMLYWNARRSLPPLDANPATAIARQLIESDSLCTKGQDIGNLVFGIRSLGASPVARVVVAALAEKIGKSKAYINAANASNALEGIGDLADGEEVRALLAALLPKLQASRKDAMSSEQFARALGGLHRLNDDGPVVPLLTELLVRMDTASTAFDAQALGVACGGLSSMHCGSEPADAFRVRFGALLADAQGNKAPLLLTAEQIGRCARAMHGAPDGSGGAAALARGLRAQLLRTTPRFDCAAFGDLVRPLARFAGSVDGHAALVALADCVRAAPPSLPGGLFEAMRVVGHLATLGDASVGCTLLSALLPALEAALVRDASSLQEGGDAQLVVDDSEARAIAWLRALPACAEAETVVRLLTVACDDVFPAPAALERLN